MIKTISYKLVVISENGETYVNQLKMNLTWLKHFIIRDHNGSGWKCKLLKFNFERGSWNITVFCEKNNLIILFYSTFS